MSIDAKIISEVYVEACAEGQRSLQEAYMLILNDDLPGDDDKKKIRIVKLLAKAEECLVLVLRSSELTVALVEKARAEGAVESAPAIDAEQSHPTPQ